MKFVYLAKGKLHLMDNGRGPTVIESKFAQSVRDRAVQLMRKDAWKSEGSGAQFMSGRLLWGASSQDPSRMRISIRGLSRGPADGRIIYSLATDDIGGVFSVSTEDLVEQRLFHQSRYFIEHLSASPEQDMIACTVRTGAGTANIAFMKSDGSELRDATEGDSVDLAPCWIPGREKELVYQSAGIGRDANGVPRGLGPSAIYRLDMKRGEVACLVEDPKQDFLGPRMTKKGELLYISRPWKQGTSGGSPLQAMKDFILFPFRLLHAVFQWLNFFTARYTGKPLTTAGGPQKEGADIRQMMIWGNLINAEEAMKARYKDTGDVPGLVPSTWRLVRESAGRRETLAKGVLSFDLCEDGSVVYTNGNAIYLLDPEGKCRKIHTDSEIESLVILDNCN